MKTLAAKFKASPAGRLLANTRQLCWYVQVLLYDAWRYAFWSSTFRRKYSLRSLEAELITLTHILEKGFSMPEPRLGFGNNHVHDLLLDMKLYLKRGYPTDRMGFQGAIDVLATYLSFHQGRGYQLDADLVRQIETIVKPYAAKDVAYKAIPPFDPSRFDFAEFVNHRVSVRHFCPETVPLARIEQAVETARHSPSSCNRQPWRVHVTNNPELIRQVLQQQRGNRGFGHTAPCLLAITADVSVYHGARERGTAYVDGGLFLMNLVLALLHRGVASCILNWSATVAPDRKVRRLLHLPGQEQIIALLIAGYPAAEATAPRSAKRAVDDLLTVHE